MRRPRLIALGAIALLAGCASDPAAPTEAVPLDGDFASAAPAGTIRIIIDTSPDGSADAAFSTAGRS